MNFFGGIFFVCVIIQNVLLKQAQKKSIKRATQFEMVVNSQHEINCSIRNRVNETTQNKVSQNIWEQKMGLLLAQSNASPNKTYTNWSSVVHRSNFNFGNYGTFLSYCFRWIYRLLKKYKNPVAMFFRACCCIIPYKFLELTVCARTKLNEEKAFEFI